MNNRYIFRIWDANAEAFAYSNNIDEDSPYLWGFDSVDGALKCWFRQPIIPSDPMEPAYDTGIEVTGDIEQCMGIEDTHNTLMFVGDIINDKDDKIKYIVDIRGLNYVFVHLFNDTWHELSVFDWEYLEVIGNIHENQELMS